MDTGAEIRRFLDSPGLSEATRRAYRADLEGFARWLESRRLTLTDVQTRVLTEYAAELGRTRPPLAPASIARKLSALRALLRFSLGADRVPDVAVSPRRPRRLPEAPKTQEVDALVGALAGEAPLELRN